MPANRVITSPAHLELLLRDKCRIATLHDFQVQHGYDLVCGKDVFLVVAPGMGKTIVMAAPLLAAQAAGEQGIALVVVPSKILTEQQAQVFTSYGLSALAINEDTLRLASYKDRNLLHEISLGEGIRVAVITPWMLKNEKLGEIITSAKTRSLIRWFLVDEVHLANKDDPGVWREPYTAITHMRARLPSRTIWLAATGTATILETSQISRLLGFRPGSYVNTRYTLDRCNIKYIPRFLEHAVSGSVFLDLSFLIPIALTCANDIPSTIIFCPTIELGHRVIQFLEGLLPANLPNRDKIIMPCNSLLDLDEREDFKTGMTSGRTRISAVTDTCTYGFNICAERVVTLSVGELPPYSKLVQQWGRVARDGSLGLVYAFVPSWVREVPPEDVVTKQQKEDKARRDRLPPVVVNWFNASAEHCPREVHLAYNKEAFTRPEHCCSKHDPNPQEALDRALVAAWKERLEKATQSKERAPRSDGTFCPLEPHMKETVKRVLHRWRVRQWALIQDADTHWPSTIFLPTATISRLCEKIHVCTSPDHLQAVLGQWTHWGTHGIKLYELVMQILEGFDEIFRDRLEPEDEVVEIPAPQGSDISRRPRLVLKLSQAVSAEVTTTVKSEPDDAALMVPKKRKRNGEGAAMEEGKGKENMSMQ